MILNRITVGVAALRGEARRSFSLPDNKLITNSPQQPSVSASSSRIASIEEKQLRTLADCGTASPGTVDHTSVSAADVKSPVRDVIVTSHDFPSPVRNVRPTRLDVTGVPTPKVDSPDDRKPLVGILLNRSPRRTSALLRFVISQLKQFLYHHISHFHSCMVSPVTDLYYTLGEICILFQASVPHLKHVDTDLMVC